MSALLLPAHERQALEAGDIRADPLTDLSSRLGAPHRQASAKVREVLGQQW